MNLFIVTGKCANIPEIKKTANGYNFTHLLVDDERINQDGTVAVETYQIIAWGSLADEIVLKAKEGTIVAIKGRLSDSTFEKDQDKYYRCELLAEKIKFYD